MPSDPGDPLLPQILLQILLILLNAFFAMSEIAVISLNENRMRMQAELGDKKAAKCLILINNPTRFLSTIQIGITVGGFLASAFAADAFAGRVSNWLINSVHVSAFSPSAIHAACLVAITVLLSFIMLIAGELVPKRIAMQKPESVARSFCGVLVLLMAVFRPFVAFFTKAVNGLVRLFGVDPNKEDTEVTEEEIMYMVDAADEKGAIGKNEKEMIENIFEFNNMTAGDIIIHRTEVEFVQKDMATDEILALIKETGFSRFPVFDEDQDDIIGILMARDFLLARCGSGEVRTPDIIRPAYFVPETVRTDILFKNMQESSTHMAIVVDEYGGTSGIVTLEDLLEEIVGNIYDESDTTEEMKIIPMEGGACRVSGSCELEQLAEAFSAALPLDRDFDTLGGLILDELSQLPKDGATPELTAYGLRLTVLEVRDHRIEWVKVEKAAPPENQEGHC